MTLPRLWLCADLDHPRADALTARVADVLRAVEATVWLRAPAGVPARRVLDVARALRRVARHLVVGDRLDVALLVAADGLHLPAHGFDAHDARSRWREVLSAAAHDEAELLRARDAADVAVVSPFGAVPGKGAALGAEGLARRVAAARPMAVVALGGVSTADDVARCVAAGADGVAVRRALLDVDDPAAVCAALARALPAGGLTTARHR